MSTRPLVPTRKNALSIPRDDSQVEFAIESITTALGVAREALASAQAIEHVWGNLPRLLSEIPERHRDELMARMCVAVATGLFDAAINYIWNITITELRSKIKDYGLSLASQVTGQKLSETSLNELKDASLLKYCLELNLISEDGFFFLDQCRDIRNNFSVAHPSMGHVDEDELVSYIKRCGKYALSSTVNPRGVDLASMFKVLRADKFTPHQQKNWKDRIDATHDAQRTAIIGMLHALYADPAEKEETRVNCLALSRDFTDDFTDLLASNLVDQHRDYLAKGDEKRYRKSLEYFEKLGIVNLLGDSEVHALVTSACKNLMSVHNAFNNFHDEPPFAQRLAEMVEHTAVPASAKAVYVETVATCSVGNAYGTSRVADVYYQKLIKQFTGKEIQIFLGLPKKSEYLARRIRHYARCKDKFKQLVKLFDEDSVPTHAKKIYQKFIEESSEEPYDD